MLTRFQRICIVTTVMALVITTSPLGLAHVPVVRSESAAEREIAIVTGGDYDREPAVAFNAQAGEYLVVWKRGASNSDIYAVRVSATGETLGSPTAVCTDAQIQEHPAVAYNGQSNNYLVVWQSGAGQASIDPQVHVFGRLVSATGVPQSATVRISNGPGMNLEVEPDVAYNDSSRQYLVVWRDGTVDILGQLVSSAGALVGSNYYVSQAYRQQNVPSVAYNSRTGQYLVAYDDHRRSVQWDIYATMLNSSGTVSGSDVGVCLDDGDQSMPAIEYCSLTNSYLAAWQDMRTGAITGTIYAQQISGQGGLQGTSFPVSLGTTGHNTPTLGFDPGTNRWSVAWADERAGNIGGRMLYSDGSYVGAPFYFCSSVGVQTNPAMAANTNSGGGYLLVWEDWRNGGADLYGYIRSAGGVEPSRTPTYTPTATRTATPTRTPTGFPTPTRAPPGSAELNYLPAVVRGHLASGPVTDENGQAIIHLPQADLQVTVQDGSGQPAVGVELATLVEGQRALLIVYDTAQRYYPTFQEVDLSQAISASAQTFPVIIVLAIITGVQLGIAIYRYREDRPTVLEQTRDYTDYCYTMEELVRENNLGVSLLLALIPGDEVFAVASIVAGATIQEDVIRDLLTNYLCDNGGYHPVWIRRYEHSQSDEVGLERIMGPCGTQVDICSGRERYTVSGRVRDATTLAGILAASVRVDPEGFPATTGYDGSYMLTGVPEGWQILSASKLGYVTGYQRVQVGPGTNTADFDLSPAGEYDEYRFILHWGANPRDLDSHLWLPSDHPYHVCYYQEGSLLQFPYASLDVDDRSRYGPETVTMKKQYNGDYLYAVKRFAGSGTLAGSGAWVDVYAGSTRIDQVAVPTSGTGDWWVVAKVEGLLGRYRRHNYITATDPAPYPD